MKNLSKIARAYALKNAISYGGKGKTGNVISSLFNEGLKKEDVKKYSKEINEIVSEINSLSQEEQKKEFEKLKSKVSERETREGLSELPNAKKGKIVMRFAPSPSGPFHVGHAATACISFLYVQKYGGKFYIRIEDTNPENIDPKAYNLIKKDSDWLFDKKAKIVIQSDNVEKYYKYVKKLLAKNSVYVCTCEAEKFREFISEKKACPCRGNGEKENKSRWEKMLDRNGYGEGEAVLRFKSDMKDKNPAMRDFPLARINLTKHPRQKNKYRVWPLMNLAVTVDDIEMKMTHIIRAKDHRDNAKRQEKIYEALDLRKRLPWVSFLGRIKFKDLDLSSSKMREEIEKGKYKGWSDSRLPTIQSLKKQGYKPSAFWKFAERVGLSENDKVIDKEEYFKLLKSFNRD